MLILILNPVPAVTVNRTLRMVQDNKLFNMEDFAYPRFQGHTVSSFQADICRPFLLC